MMAAGWLLVACSEVDDHQAQSREPIPIRLAVVIDSVAQTRAGTSVQSTELVSGEAVDVYIKNITSGGWIANPLNCTVSGSSGDLTSSTTTYYPMDGSSVSMYAVHPSIASGAAFSVADDQTSDANYAVSDLTYSKTATYAFSTSVHALPMVHAMAKIIVNISLPTAWSGRAVTDLKLHAKRTATMTFPVANSDGYTLSSASGDGTITMSAGGAALIPPQTITSGSTFITFNIAGVGPYAYVLPADRTFEAGKQYTYTVTPNSASLSYAVTSATHNKWAGTYTNPLTNTGSGLVVFTSSNTAVATVHSTTGVVTPISKGTTTITAQIVDGLNNYYTTKTASYNLTINAISSSDIGKVLGANGQVYASATAATNAGTVASGIICYVGSNVDVSNSSYNCLVRAMTSAGGTNAQCRWCDATNMTCVSQSSNEATALTYLNGLESTNTLVNCKAHNHYPAQRVRSVTTARPAGASAWFLPSVGQWKLIAQGLASKTSNPSNYQYSNVNTAFSGTGADAFWANGYWSSTEYSPTNAWGWSFYPPGGPYGTVGKTDGISTYPAYPVFAY